MLDKKLLHKRLHIRGIQPKLPGHGSGAARNKRICVNDHSLTVAHDFRRRAQQQMPLHDVSEERLEQAVWVVAGGKSVVPAGGLVLVMYPFG